MNAHRDAVKIPPLTRFDLFQVRPTPAGSPRPSDSALSALPATNAESRLEVVELPRLGGHGVHQAGATPFRLAETLFSQRPDTEEPPDRYCLLLRLRPSPHGLRQLITNIRRSLQLFGPVYGRRIVATAIASALVALLDLLGILLLVPFLSYLGSGSPSSGFAVSFIEDNFGVTNPDRAVLILALLATLLFVAKGLVAVTLVWIQSGQIVRAQSALSVRIAGAYARSPWLVQQESTTGSLVRTSIDSVQSVAYLVVAATAAASELAVLAAVFAALMLVDPLLALSATAYLVISGAIYLRLVRRTMVARGVEIQIEAKKRNSALIELVGGARELKVRGTSGTYLARFGTACFTYLSAHRLVNVTNQGMRYLLEALMIVGVALVIVVASVSGSAQDALVSIGILLAGGLRLVPALNGLLISVNTVRTEGPATVIIENELQRLEDGTPQTDPFVSSFGFVPSGRFSLESVSFRYPSRSDPALKDVSVGVDSGEAIGIVGATGSGKSTLVDMILGLVEPDSGRVTVDGEPLNKHLEDWRRCIGFVPQDVFLVDDTLESNIRFGLPDGVAGGDLLDHVVGLASLGAVVEALPEGLQTMLGERGVRLSGGQRQRVGLARALYSQPSLLLLDEATSALDNETEAAINIALQGLHGTLTMVVIAHRLSTVRECDRILFLDSGSVSGLGSFEDLVRTNKAFAQLVELGSVKGTF
jgi:ABC-type multidrug transport system fused ATPase/permease subunit